MNIRYATFISLALILISITGCASDQTVYVEPLDPPGYRPPPAPFYGQPDGPGFGPAPPGGGFGPPPPPP